MSKKKLGREEEELKAKIDKALADEKYVQRKVDTIASVISEEPSAILNICCQFPEEYNLSSTKKSGVLISSVERMLKVLEEEELKVRDLFEGGEEDPDAILDPARRDMVQKPVKIKTEWDRIGHNVSHCYLVMQRTLRMMPNGHEKITMERMIRDLETLYTDVCKHQSLPIE